MIDYEDLARTKLFSGISPIEIARLLDCVSAKCAEYAPNDYIVEEGSRLSAFGIVLSGHGQSIRTRSQ